MTGQQHERQSIDHLDFDTLCECGKPGRWIIACHCGWTAVLVLCTGCAAESARLYGPGGNKILACPSCRRSINVHTDFQAL